MVRRVQGCYECGSAGDVVADDGVCAWDGVDPYSLCLERKGVEERRAQLAPLGRNYLKYLPFCISCEMRGSAGV